MLSLGEWQILHFGYNKDYFLSSLMKMGIVAIHDKNMSEGKSFQQHETVCCPGRPQGMWRGMIPPTIVRTGSRPDLVIVDSVGRTVWLLELTDKL